MNLLIAILDRFRLLWRGFMESAHIPLRCFAKLQSSFYCWFAGGDCPVFCCRIHLGFQHQTEFHFLGLSTAGLNTIIQLIITNSRLPVEHRDFPNSEVAVSGV